MSPSWPCPQCGREIPDPEVRDAPDFPGHTRQTCPGCGTSLLRDAGNGEQGWQAEPERRMGGG